MSLPAVSLPAVIRLVGLTLLCYLSLLLAVFGAFLVPQTLQGVSVGVVIAVVGNFSLGTAGRRVVGGALGAVLPGVVWLVAALALAGGRREGDVVLTSSAGSIGFLLLGAMAYAVAIGRRPATRSSTPRSPTPRSPASPIDEAE